MDFQYISRSVRGPGCSDAWEETLEGCECIGPCTAEQGCTCLLGAEDNYSPDGLLLAKESGAPLLECHSECGCEAEECRNRVMQKGVQRKLKVFRSPDGKGFGLRALDAIPQGAFVCEYAGEIIDAAEVEKRCAEPREHNYIFTLKEQSGEQVSYTFVDPRLKGSLARFINHSCEPNLVPNAVRIGCPVPRVGFFAARDIEAGEELSYDYGPSGIQGNKRCLCGAASCRGYLPMSATPSQ